MSISNLAQVVFEDHRRKSDKYFYDTKALGGMFYRGDLKRLDAAYAELEAEGLLFRTKHTRSSFGDSVPLYGLTELGTSVEIGVGHELRRGPGGSGWEPRRGDLLIL